MRVFINKGQCWDLASVSTHGGGSRSWWWDAGQRWGSRGERLEPRWVGVPELRGAEVIQSLVDHFRKWLFKQNTGFSGGGGAGTRGAPVSGARCLPLSDVTGPPPHLRTSRLSPWERTVMSRSEGPVRSGAGSVGPGDGGDRAGERAGGSGGGRVAMATGPSRVGPSRAEPGAEGGRAVPD